MSATDELRRLLDERGVEYDTRDGNIVKNTYWSCNGLRWGYNEDVSDSGMTDPMLFPIAGGQLTFTPEQVIAATLGGGEKTCRLDNTISWEFRDMTFFSHELTCGHVVEWDDSLPPNYCPECGAKVVHDDQA